MATGFATAGRGRYRCEGLAGLKSKLFWQLKFSVDSSGIPLAFTAIEDQLPQSSEVSFGTDYVSFGYAASWGSRFEMRCRLLSQNSGFLTCLDLDGSSDRPVAGLEFRRQ